MTATAVCQFSGIGPVARGRWGTPRTVLNVTTPISVTANRWVRSIGFTRSCSVRIARHQHPEDWTAAHVRERQLDAVRGGIDRDPGRLRRPGPAQRHDGGHPLPEHRHGPGLGGYTHPGAP